MIMMIIFLLIFLFLYGGINFYAFFQAKNIFHFTPKTEVIIIASLCLLVLAPIIIRFVEKIHWETLARIIAYCGYLWMAFVFLFFFINITLETSRYLLNFIIPNAGGAFQKSFIFGLTVFLSFASVVYGYFDAEKIRINRLEIHTEKPLPENGRLRIVQISDVHIGLIVRNERLKVIADKIEEARPDMLISTGDLLDGELDNVMSEAELFARIKPQYGKYAVTGNHEYYAGINKSLEFTTRAGFEILRDETRKVAGINIIGLEDPTGRQMGFLKNNFKISDLFPKQQDNEFSLLLKHQPVVKENNNFDLQLSGHTHGGQIFPFMWITRLFFSKNCGYYKLGEYKAIYVSRGAGTWGPPVRLFAPPEITVIDLTKK